MKYGKAYYCDGEECGVEIVSGNYCQACDPENGSEEVSYTFLGNWTGGEDSPETVAQPESQSTGKWWQFWR